MNIYLLKSYTFIIFSCMFMLTGCGRASFTDTRSLSGYVSTSVKDFPITKTDEYWGRFHSDFKLGSLSVVPFKGVNSPPGGTLEFWFWGGSEKHSTFKPISAFYQVNKEPVVPIDLICRVHNTSSNGNTEVTCKYLLPDILNKASYNQPAEGMRSTTKIAIESSIDDTYRFMMNFNYEDGSNPITVEFAFKLKINNKLRFGIPGGSP